MALCLASSASLVYGHLKSLYTGIQLRETCTSQSSGIWGAVHRCHTSIILSYNMVLAALSVGHHFNSHHDAR